MNNLNAARTLSLDEIKELPKGSVIWYSFVDNDGEDGIIWHDVFPVMVAVPGAGGFIVGGSEAGIFDNSIDETLFKDPAAICWDQEPDDDQLPGISGSEYDLISGGPVTMSLAAAITSRWKNFKDFCKESGFNYDSFMAAIAGERDFMPQELDSIFNMMDLTTDEIHGMEERILDMNNTSEENRKIFRDIMDQAIGRPDIHQFCLNYNGDYKKLPAILKQMI